MSRPEQRKRAAWMAVGLVLGLILGGLWPESPAHAVATAQHDNFAICTALVDEEGEGIFFLDSLTGDLKGAVLNPQSRKFSAYMQTNVVADLGVDPTKNPRFLMVSGAADFRRSPGNTQLASTAIYVAELTSGKVIAYGVPWARAARNTAQPLKATFAKLDAFQFREVVVREQ